MRIRDADLEVLMRRLRCFLLGTATTLACGEQIDPTAPGSPNPPGSPPPPPPPAVTVVEVSPAADTLVALGASVQLAAVARDQDGNVMAGVAFTWTSSDGAVVSVDGDGLATAEAGGTASVVATANGVADTAAIAVVQLATTLAFSTQPITVQGNEVLAPVQVAILDGGGSQVQGAADPVTVSLLSAPHRTSLGGTLTVSAVDGVATFDDLRVDNPAQLVLVAEVNGLGTVESDAFDVELTFASVATGTWHSCGVTAAGHGYCWGNNGNGKLGDETMTEAMHPVLVHGDLSFTEIVAALNSSCGRTTNGEAYCWGDNQLGQLGDGSTTASLPPVLVSGSHTFTDLTAGTVHVCGITASGDLYCWGYNGSGQLGDGTTTSRSSPVLVAGGHAFTSVTAAATHTCGLTTAGEVYCWGANGSGQLGIGSTTWTATPALVAGHTFVSVAGQALTTCAVDVAGATWCWGDNQNGGVGDGTTINRTAPEPVSGSSTFAWVQGAGLRSCGLDAAGAAYCWGDNEFGMLGDGNAPTDSFTPVAVAGGHAFVQLSVGHRHACGLRSDGNVYCWGRNGNAQLGSGDHTDGLAPVRLVQ